MTEAPARHLGISIEPLRIAATHVVCGNSDVSFKGLEVARSEIPPAVLLPRLPGEPLRLETGPPFHPRGAGRNWPPESLAATDEFGPRMPLALAWPPLNAVTSPHWNWTTPEGILQDATPIDALATAVAAASHRADDVADDLVLVIPNNLRMNRQQELIDSCREHDCSVKLLWRPVAAALAWCEAHGLDLLARSVPCSRRAGRLLCLHLGLDEFELTFLELVERPDELGRWLLPARPRPDVGRTTLPSFGLDLVVPALDHPLRSDLWMSPLIGRTLHSVEKTPNGCVTELLRRGAMSKWRDRFAERDTWLPGQTSFAEFEQWLNRAVGFDAVKGSPNQHEVGARQKVMFREAPVVTEKVANGDDLRSAQLDDVIGAVITGDLARLPAHGTTLWQYACQKLGLTSNNLTLVEPKPATKGENELSTQTDCSLLARGAAIHALRLARNEPSYLDTLPHVKIAVRDAGEMVWLDLLKGDDEYVDGGRNWKRPEPVRGLHVRAGKQGIELALWHDEFSTVRKWSGKFNQPAREDVPLELQVTIAPAQGNARVDVVPVDREAAVVRRIQLDWHRMTDTELAPLAWIAKQEKYFPTTLLRATSARRWKAAEEAMTAYLKSPSGYALLFAIDRLKQPEKRTENTKGEEASATAISSEGVPPVGDSRTLEAFVRRLVAEIGANQHPTKEIIRALAYTSTSHRTFQQFLVRQLREATTSISDDELKGCGLCLRDSKHIAKFANVVAERLRQGLYGSHEWLKAFGRVLRYRDDATEFITTDCCVELTDLILRVFENERASRVADYKFRDSCLCIVYLLRRRKFADAFLALGSAHHLKVRGAFLRAKQDVENRILRPIGGAIDLASELQKMVDFIDKVGGEEPGVS